MQYFKNILTYDILIHYIDLFYDCHIGLVLIAN